MKSFAAEIAHLRQTIDKKAQPAETVNLPKVIPEEIKQEKFTPEEIKPQGNACLPARQGLVSDSQSHKPEEALPEEARQEGIKLEETKAVEEIKTAEENLEKKIKETEEPQ